MIRPYTVVRVSLCVKPEIEAVDSALDGLNLLWAIWNFNLNYPQAWCSSDGKRSPVNKKVLGPVHSQHEPNGKSAVDYNWYEPDYFGPLKLVRLDQYLDAM